jgi:uroporphyrinogen-III decarboxylase
MTRSERLWKILRGQPVDRPAVCFNEINSVDENPDDPSSFNIFSDPSWQPLIELARNAADNIVLRGSAFNEFIPDPVERFARTRTFMADGHQHTIKEITVGSRTLTSHTRRDPDINTIWTVEHFLKSVDDVHTLLQLPIEEAVGKADARRIWQTEEKLGDRGVVMLDTPDPICLAAGLFSMEVFTVVAMTEPALFHRLLEKFAAFIYPITETMAELAPAHGWRIYGPEYASPPFLPPRLFHDYVHRYDEPMIRMIHRTDGFVRLHCHGRIRDILPDILDMGSDGLDPIEPPPQGDMQLWQVRELAGSQLVLFGNIELSDIENLSVADFSVKVKQALAEGTAGDGRGFVLMPSACPIGRVLKKSTLDNYQTMVRLTQEWGA